MNTFFNAQIEGFLSSTQSLQLNDRITIRGIKEQSYAANDEAKWKANKISQAVTGSRMTDKSDFPAAKRLAQAQNYMRLRGWTKTF